MAHTHRVRPEDEPFLFSDPLQLLGFAESKTSVTADLRVWPATRAVDAALAVAVCALRPTLAQHSCKQRSIGLFGDKIEGTTLPHLVEHLAIDFMVEGRCSTALPAIAGTTRWLDREQGIMQVRVSCTPQSAESTRQAIVRSVELVNSLLER